MSNIKIFIVLPLTGYMSLWFLGSILFLLYFRLFNIQYNLKSTTEMISKLPELLSIFTVSFCSFISFFLTARIISRTLPEKISTIRALQAGFISLLITIILDLIIAVFIERVDILVFPINLIYLFAWLVIIPAVLLGTS